MRGDSLCFSAYVQQELLNEKGPGRCPGPSSLSCCVLGLAQFEHANAGRNGHAGLMLQAERLQRNRAGIAAN